MPSPGTPTRDYRFPGTPYGPQTQLMDALYDAMQRGAAGLFESPTGTGKTLAIICAVATYVRDERRVPALADGADWVAAHEQNRLRAEKLRSERGRAERRARRVRHVESPAEVGEGTKKRHRARTRALTEDEFLLADGDAPAQCADDEPVFSDEEGPRPPTPREQLAVRPLRVLFVTRTHSQLAQFVQEFRKTGHAAGADAVSVVLFGSRKHMCVNDAVRALGGAGAINDRCRELNEAKAAAGSGAKRARARRVGGCEARSRAGEELLRDQALTALHTPLELEEAARRQGGCPYYAARAALDSNDADVVGVPYSALLHAPTRRSLGLHVDSDTVVVFDEAHNLVSAVCDLNAATLTADALRAARTAMLRYKLRYESRLSTFNLFYLRQLVAVAKGLIHLLDKVQNDAKPRVLTPAEVVFEAMVDNVNLYPLVEFMRESRLTNKLRGFVELAVREEAREEGQKNDDQVNAAKCKVKGVKVVQACKVDPTVRRKPTVGADEQASEAMRAAAAGLTSFESFIGALADCPSYARLALYPKTDSVPGKSALASACRYKFFVLEPEALFKEALADARAVLMLGGTLSPREAIKERLLKGLSHPVIEFECDHVVPAEHVRTAVVGVGPRGHVLQLTHRARANWAATDEVGRALVQLAAVAPGGVVAFFTSYDYLEVCSKRWAGTGTMSGMKRPVYFEGRADGGAAFEKYSMAVRDDPVGGAFLAAVMGGRLSEGINFTDELGRLVVIVGMPFANAQDVEMAECLRNVASPKERSRLLVHGCMTVVNQCVGRAVRHSGDYAAVVLLDSRYARESTKCLLPRFVRRNCVVPRQFGEATNVVAQFFRKHEGKRG